MKKAIIGLVCLVVIFFGIDMGMNLDHRAFLVRAYTNDCIVGLNRLGEVMYDLVNHPDEAEPAFKLRPEQSVSDLIGEIVSRGTLPPKDVCCKYGDGLPYLVFSEPASVFLEDNEGPRVPVLMDRPDSHRESAFLMSMFSLYHWHWNKGKLANTSRVLYSDGSIGTLSREDAEKLIAAKSPVPISLPAEYQAELRAVREKALARKNGEE